MPLIKKILTKISNFHTFVSNNCLKYYERQENRIENTKRHYRNGGQNLCRRGYSKATVRDICRQAGVNIAAINYHFGDKKGLYLSVLKHYQEISLKTILPISASMKRSNRKKSCIPTSGLFSHESWMTAIPPGSAG